MGALNRNHVCADVSIQDDSEKKVDVNPFDFNLTTPAGITVNVDFTTSSNLQTAAVNPGGNLAGAVCFESDAAPGEYKLGYEPTFSLRNAFWNGQL